MSEVAALRARIVARVGSLDLEVDLDTGPGTLVLVGPNGAGKSTLLALVLGALPVARGSVSVGEARLLDTAAGLDLALEERRLGYVPQDYALFPHLSVRGNVEFALSSAEPRAARARSAERVDALLRDFGLTELAARRPASLSGGERQRLALARALSVQPRALLLDEPLSALDVHARGEVRAYLSTTLRELRIPALLVTHDARDARTLGQRIAVLEAGRISQTGTWTELAERPASRFVRDFVASASKD